MVGVAGFEPTTSPTPRVCASQAALYSAKIAIIAKFSQIVLNYDSKWLSGRVAMSSYRFVWLVKSSFPLMSRLCRA